MNGITAWHKYIERHVRRLKHANRAIQTQSGRHRPAYTWSLTYRYGDNQSQRQKDRDASRETDRKHASRQAGRQTGWQTVIRVKTWSRHTESTNKEHLLKSRGRGVLTYDIGVGCLLTGGGVRLLLKLLGAPVGVAVDQRAESTAEERAERGGGGSYYHSQQMQ